MEQNYTRRFSLERNFMDYDSDDLLYGALQYLATYHPELHKLYLTKKNYTKHKKELMSLCGCDSRGIKRRLDKLIEKKLVKEEDIFIGANKEVYACFTFPHKFEDKYQIINNEMLWYVVSTRNQQAVRIYIQLLNWYNWKAQEGDSYVFTNKELMRVLGYNETYALASSMITNILESFAREGIISYQEYYEERIDNSGKSLPTPKKRLTFVAQTKDQLRKI